VVGELASLAAALCWAVGLNLFRRDVRLIGARAVNLFKGILGCTLFLLVLLATGVPYADPRSITLFALSGVIGLALGDSLLFAALGHLGPHRTALLASLSPVFTAVGAWMFRDETLGSVQIAGILMAVVGVSLVVWFRPHGAEPKRADAVGVLFGITAALCQAGGVVVSKEAFAGADVPLLSGVLRLGAATLILAVFALVRGELDHQLKRLYSPRPFRRLLLASLVGTFAGIWLMQIGIAYTDSAVASALHSTTPLFTLPIAYFVMRERIGARVAGASCLAVAGVVMLLLS
jgi:drug/metabolite transporter (DMT)-like permease